MIQGRPSRTPPGDESQALNCARPSQMSLPLPSTLPLSWLDQYRLYEWLYWGRDGYVG